MPRGCGLGLKMLTISSIFILHLQQPEYPFNYIKFMSPRSPYNMCEMRVHPFQIV